MPHPKVKISDDSGNTVAVDTSGASNALKVALVDSASIDIGDVSLLLDGTAADYGTGNVNTSGRTLRVTLASDDVHFGTVGTAADYDGTIHGQLRYIADQVKLAYDELVSIDADTNAIIYPYTTLGTGTYTEGTTVANMIGAVRNDTLDALANTNNETAPFQVNANGALYVTGESKHDSAVTDYGIGIMGEAKTIDGSALPNSTAEGDAIRIAATRAGILYTTLSNVGGLKSPIIDDDDGQVATPAMVNVGGEYRSGATTYADGDATILQTNVNGALEVVGTVDLGSTDNAVLDAMVVDLAAMEALLITIDSDTNAIKTAVEILDDWDDSNYANVNINLAGTDAPTGGGAESGALRVTLANDSTGVISIDDGGNTITVDGTVTANLGTTDNGVLDAIAASLALLDNSIASGNELQVDVVAALPAGDNNIGNVDIVTLPASTNTIEVVGDVAENENAAGNPVLIGGRYDTSARTLGNTDVGALALNASGHVLMDVVNGGVLESLLDGVETLLSSPASTSSGSNIIGRVGHDITGGADGTKVVSSAGTDVVLGGDVDCKKIDIQAQTDNTGLIAVGFTGVDATEATGTGVILYAGDTYSLEMVNLNLIYIDSTVSGEGVRYTYFT